MDDLKECGEVWKGSAEEQNQALEAFLDKVGRDAGDQPLQIPSLPDELQDFTLSFLAPPKSFISLSVPESLYHRLQRYGISRFYEEAVREFDGDLKALLVAALQFIKARKNRKPMEGICNANGRVLKETLHKLEGIKESLAGIRGMSRAKVLAGLVQIKLNTMN
jgi:hypothetical protein